jgi:hypothetical protein
MIHYLVTRAHCYTMLPFLKYWARDFQQHLKILTYESLWTLSELKPGTYIFTDIDRLTPLQRDYCSRLWSRLQHSPGFRPVNHPTQSMRRYELLNTLYAQQINRFRAYRPTEPGTPWKFPLFIRLENRHRALSSLLHSQVELESALIGLKDRPGEKLIVEFCNTSDEDGIYRKFSAYMVGETVIPIHIMRSQNWLVKGATINDPAARKEEEEYLSNNPHQEQIRSLFKTARIEYGRIDYSLLDGDLQVWEINTNPTLLPLKRLNGRRELKTAFLRQYRKAMHELERICSGMGGEALSIEPLAPPVGRSLALLQAAENWLLQRFFFYSFGRVSRFSSLEELYLFLKSSIGHRVKKPSPLSVRH